MDADDELERRPEPSAAELDAIIGIYHPVPRTRAVNQAVGLVDELERLVAAFFLVLAVLLGLSAGVSPWFWIGVGVWVGYAVAVFIWLRRRRKPAQQQLTDGPR